MKICIHCKQSKSLDDFVKSKSATIDGHLNQCKNCHNSIGKKRYHASWDKQRMRRELKHVNLKLSALNAYGAVCQCCQESQSAFLTIDHVYNDGAEHRKLVSGGHNFYQWLKNNGYPSGFQVLCMNCNWSKYTNGGVCIHQEIVS